MDEPVRESRAWARGRVRALLVEGLVEGLTGALRLAAAPFTASAWRRRIRRIMARRVAPCSVPVPDRTHRSLRVFLVAGEPSGDQRAADLVRAIRGLVPGVRFEGLGGARMEEAGVEIHTRMDHLDVMGFRGVVARVKTFANLLVELLVRLRRDPPDVLVLVDYPGFNLRAARAARPLGIPTVEYVAPQVWAWAPWRIPTVGRSVDLILSILPFEPALFRRTSARTLFTGHPLVERLDAESREPWRADGCWIGLLPGSRRQEVERLLPLMLRTAARVAERVPDARFVVPTSGSAVAEIARRLAADAPVTVEVVEDRARAVMASLRSALVASGTATLELALLGVPMSVVYPITRLQRWLRPALLISPHFALANIAAGREIVEERLVRGTGDEPEALAEGLARLTLDGASRESSLAALAEVRRDLAGEGAADRAARAVLAAATSR